MKLCFWLLKDEPSESGRAMRRKVVNLNAEMFSSDQKFAITEFRGTRGGRMFEMETKMDKVSERAAANWLCARIDVLENEGYQIDRGENMRPMRSSQYAAILLGVRSHAVDVLCRATDQTDREQTGGWDAVISWTDRELFAATGDATTIEEAIAAVGIAVKVSEDNRRNNGLPDVMEAHATT